MQPLGRAMAPARCSRGPRDRTRRTGGASATMAALTDDRVRRPIRDGDDVRMTLKRGDERAPTFASRATDSAPLFAKLACRAASTDGAEMTQMPAAP